MHTVILLWCFFKSNTSGQILLETKFHFGGFTFFYLKEYLKIEMIFIENTDHIFGATGKECLMLKCLHSQIGAYTLSFKGY